jgi:hypothetical protein
VKTTLIPAEVKWSWSCRAIPAQPLRLAVQTAAPRVGDVALVRVVALGHHTRIATAEGEKVRLYPDDTILAVFGHRYATDAFEAEIRCTDDLHLLTDAGMIGTVLSRHQSVKSPTRLEFLGFLTDEQASRKSIRREISARPILVPRSDLFLFVGTGMNSGKTTVAAKLVKALLRRGLRVAACKLTGSVCPRDFSDYGFPSTYLASEKELIDLFHAMLADADETEPDVIVMEIADGVMQRETRLLLNSEIVRQFTRGVVLAAPCAASALYGVSRLESHGLKTVAVSGCITNSPLFIREFAAESGVPIVSSTGDGAELADLILQESGRATQ